MLMYIFSASEAGDLVTGYTRHPDTRRETSIQDATWYG